jgi:hypothetical protein
MKTPKCPLCGNEMQLRSDEVCSGYYMPLYYYECIGCPLATTPVDTAKEAENQIKDLISRFPLIMRVWPGDKLQVEDGSICEVINVNKNLAMMDVRRGEGRPVFTIADTHVIRWPWELEQEGGTEQ